MHLHKPICKSDVRAQGSENKGISLSYRLADNTEVFNPEIKLSDSKNIWYFYSENTLDRGTYSYTWLRRKENEENIVLHSEIFILEQSCSVLSIWDSRSNKSTMNCASNIPMVVFISNGSILGKYTVQLDNWMHYEDNGSSIPEFRAAFPLSSGLFYYAVRLHCNRA
jgi:hypothetical protein